jgi:hypothetical protein
MEERESISFVLSRTLHERNRTLNQRRMQFKIACKEKRKPFGMGFDQQYNRYRVSVSKTEEQIKAHFKGLVAYFDINHNLK